MACTLLPLYTGERADTVNINSDTYPGTGGVLGLTRAQLEEAKKNNVKPAGGARLRLHPRSRTTR